LQRDKPIGARRRDVHHASRRWGWHGGVGGRTSAQSD
jgi:hypothetical protein